MNILISPIGESDPFGKHLPDSGDASVGPAISVARVFLPNITILLPTSVAGGHDTHSNALDTKVWIQTELPGSTVEVCPVDMDAVQDYAEAQRKYGDVLERLGSRFREDRIAINVSSGTPAIKLACMSAVAESVIAGSAWYAEDPSRSRKDAGERVYPLNVRFLRDKSLVHQVTNLIAQGQFGAAEQPLNELCGAAVDPERTTRLEHIRNLVVSLKQWSERDYVSAIATLQDVRRAWSDPSDYIRTFMKSCVSMLDNLRSVRPADGMRSWDIYFQAQRMSTAGHRCSSIEHLWISVEVVTFERLERAYGVCLGNGGLYEAVNDLTARDPTIGAMWTGSTGGQSFERLFRALREVRNQCVHQGLLPSAAEFVDTWQLAHQWLSTVGSSEPTQYPIGQQALPGVAEAIAGELR